jgi:negative regulator of flagellin synthesis FlgM
MSSKIDGVGPHAAAVSGGDRASAPGRSSERSRAAEGAASEDKVTLTDSARQLQRLADAVASAPATDSARVAVLKDAVARGEYQPDSARTAAKLAALERELVGR